MEGRGDGNKEEKQRDEKWEIEKMKVYTVTAKGWVYVKGDVCWWLSHHNPSPTEWKGKYSLDPPPPPPPPLHPLGGQRESMPCAHSFHNYAQNMWKDYNCRSGQRRNIQVGGGGGTPCCCGGVEKSRSQQEMRAPGHRGDRNARKERKHWGNNTHRGKSGPSLLPFQTPTVSVTSGVTYTV